MKCKKCGKEGAEEDENWWNYQLCLECTDKEAKQDD